MWRWRWTNSGAAMWVLLFYALLRDRSYRESREAVEFEDETRGSVSSFFLAQVRFSGSILKASQEAGMRTVLAFACVLLSAAPTALAQSPSTASTGNESQVVTVKAGTQIKVDLWDHKVSWPVQDGFTVLIPALAKVSFSEAKSQQALYSRPVGYSQSSPVVLPPQKTVQLTSVTIGGKSYSVEAAAVTVPENQREVEFTLSSVLRIER